MGCGHTVHILSYPFCRLTAKARDPSISNCANPMCSTYKEVRKEADRPLLPCTHLFRVQHSAQNYHPREVTLNVMVKTAL